MLQARLAELPGRGKASLASHAPVTHPQPTETAPPVASWDEANAILAARDDEFVGSTTAPGAPAEAQHPSHYWTWRLFTAGFSAHECQQIRTLDRPALIGHVLAIARSGQPFDLSWILAREHHLALERLASNGGAKSLAALLLQLPPEISAAEAELFWLARRT
jgi:ATP-dependent DNA helicase RecQ